MNDPVHVKSKSKSGQYITLLCKPNRVPDPEALITTVIEKVSCLDCLKVLHLAFSDGELSYANGSLDKFIEN